MSAIGWVKRAQGVKLAGVGVIPEMRHPLTPYVAMGAPQSSAYDLGAPGAVSEVKRALVGLGDKMGYPVTPLSTDDVWEAMAAIEFALMVSRYRSKMPWALSDPFMVDGPYPSTMQPTVAGLELLAGAANTDLDKAYKLATYEAWRGGAFAPPSVISRPSASAGLRPTYNVSPRSFVPSDAPSETVTLAALFENLEKTMLKEGLLADTEERRAAIKNGFEQAARDRESVVGQAIEASVATRQAAVDCEAGGGVWDDPSQTCAMTRQAPTGITQAALEPSSTGALILLGGSALALYFVLRK